MPVVLLLRRTRQEDHKVKARLGNFVRKSADAAQG